MIANLIIFTVVAGLVGLIVGMCCGIGICQTDLARRGNTPDRTPVKLDKGFYYIVPEPEYCELMVIKLDHESWRKQMNLFLKNYKGKDKE